MRFFFRHKSSCTVARDRLKILLISDRVNCSPEVMELIKSDITKVISKYMKIDTENMDVHISAKRGNASRNGRTPVLYADIPILDFHKQGGHAL